MYTVSAIVSAVFVLLISVWIRRRKQRFNIFKRYKIPGPKPNFFYGNLLEFQEKKNEIVEEWIQKYGKIFGFFIGAKPFVVCADIELLKHCQIKDVKNFINKDWTLPDAGIPHYSAEYMLGIQKDEKWKKLRRILGSCFSSGKIKMMSTLMSDPIKLFLKSVKAKQGQPFDISKLSQLLIFDIICTSAFGVSTNVQNNETNILIKSVQAVFGLHSSDILAFLSMCFPELEPLPTKLRHFRDTIKYIMKKPAVEVIYNTCKNIINSRKNSGYHPPDLLQTIIDAEDENATEKTKLPDNFVIANALLFMAGGYDTTSNTIAWCFHYLAHNPEIQQKVRLEINNNVKREMEIQYSDLNNLQYLDQVISETLRFWPFSFLLVNRLCAEDFPYKDIIIPKGSAVTAPICYLHNDPTYWNKPQNFDPDRFSQDKRGEFESIMYQPFGTGPKMCIGMRLAKTIMRLIIANLIRSFRVEACGNDAVEVEYSFFISHPKNGVIIKAIPINS